MKLKYIYQPLILFLSLLTIVSLLSISLTIPAEAAPPVGPDKLADFEVDVPGGWFVFQGASSVTTTVLIVGAADALARPAQVGDNGILEVDFNISDFGGFGADFVASGPQDWSTTDGFSFWFYGTGSGLAYQAEISDNRSDPSFDTSERFDYTFVDDIPGWRRISIPWSDFTRATDFQPGGAPDDGFTLTEIWAWAIVLPLGADIVYFDDFGVENHIIDDFESGVAPGTSCVGIPLGFCTFQGAGSSVSITATTTPPAPLLPELGAPNTVIQVDLDVSSFAGFIHGFTNEAVNAWVPQDWSAYQGFAFWLFGNNSGTNMFIDLLENRNPGSTTDDAERWTVTIPDDFSGWRYFEYPFTDFVRKDVGNGAPNDGLSLTEVHGWAFGTLGTGGAVTYYMDNVGLYGVAGSIPLTVAFSNGIFDIEEGTTGTVTVKLNRPMVASDPDAVSVDYATEPAIAVPDRDYTPTAGSFTFVQGGPQEQSFSIETFDNNKFTGNKRIVLRLSNPVDVELGLIRQASALIQDNDSFDPNLLDDFERGPYLWQADDDEIALATTEIASGDPMAIPGQDTFENILSVSAPIAVDTLIAGSLCNNGNGVVPVAILTTDYFDASAVDHTTVRFGDATETHGNKKNVQRHEEDFDGDGDIDLVFHFRLKETGYDCDTTDTGLTGTTFSGQAIGAGGNPAFGHDFALGQDWTRAEALRFWFYGTGSGDEIGVTLKDNRAPDPGPSGWDLVWSDEFDEPAGTPPNPANWIHEIGDVTPDGKNGWGNEERQYYTDDPANAATDGNGNLVITLREADSSLECYYGTCEYTSARLKSTDRTEFTYGRIESRLRVPDGDPGLWPAFWSLGTDIDRNPWPGAGEIDFMEYVSRLPNEIFGTIHGPGYSGGGSFGGLYDFGEPVYNDYHTFAVEWEPNEIRWYVDDILYHTATQADVSPNPWVFDKPFFMLLNFAIGGNFGGPVDPDLVFPQEYLIDYIRLFQAPDTAERFEASFVDNFTGWQEVVIPLSVFTRSDDQPAGAPNDGLNLTDVWGYGFSLPDGGTTDGSLRLDQVRLQLLPPPMAITVANLNNDSSGSLRQALEDIAIGGTITFDPGLAGGTIELTTGPLVPKGDVTIDASDAPGLTLDGGGGDRVLIVDAGLTVNASHLTVANGYGFQLAGGILNNGNLTLYHVIVTSNLVTTDAGDFWQGGGGIYVGGGGSLSLIDSTVSGNETQGGIDGGGVYSFFGTSLTIERSTISGNTASNVGGGMRTLGNSNILNSTLSGNVSTAWHGGAIFHTDGQMSITNSTITGNTAPGGTAAGIVSADFGGLAPVITLANTIVANNITGTSCAVVNFGGGAANVVSAGYNIDSDNTCNLIAAGDQPNTDPMVGPLAGNGGPTLTHALLAGSPAIDAADDAVCPATDQRGVARPQGASCDVGAYEFEP